ncbi:MAG: glycosyltransferase family 2 protein [Planctomycetota bacterium]
MRKGRAKEVFESTVSVVVPIYNEFKNVELLYHELVDVLESQSRIFELVLVDDGSIDGTTERLKEIAENDDRVKLILFRKNYGQTAALQAGIQNSSGQFIAMLDGDLQNDARDLPMMFDKLDEGYDLVHGWRKNRQDNLVSRKIPSRIANWLVSKVTDFPIHDLGCTLKVIRADVARQLELYGEMHRFIPILAHQLGAKSVEVVTRHRARKFGETKYGLGRVPRVILDLITVNFMLKYFSSPMKLFGKLGIFASMVGSGALAATVWMKLVNGIDMTGNPLLLLGIIAWLLAAQFVSIGLIGEVCARIYYQPNRHTNYQVRDFVNFDTPDTIPFRSRQVA